MQSKSKITFFQNVEDLSQVTWQFFETYKNCMTLLWRGHVVVIIITYFCIRVNPKLKKHTGYGLIIFIIGSISIWDLLYRPCYSIKFIIPLNEGLELQLLGKNSSISYRFCI